MSSRCSAWGRFVTRQQRTDTAPEERLRVCDPWAPAGLGLRSSGCPCGSGAPDGIAPAAAVPPPHSPLRGHPWVSPSPRAQSWGHAQGRTAGCCLLAVTEAGQGPAPHQHSPCFITAPLCVRTTLISCAGTDARAWRARTGCPSGEGKTRLVPLCVGPACFLLELSMRF